MTQVAERFFAQWWKGYFTSKRLNAITAGALEEARQSLLTTVVLEAKGKGEVNKLMSPQRVNRYMEWLRHVVNVVVREGKLASNPVLKLTMYKEPKGNTRFLSMEEEKMLLEKLGPIHGPWARLAILTGLRQGRTVQAAMEGCGPGTGHSDLVDYKDGKSAVCPPQRRSQVDTARARLLATVEVGLSL